VPPRTVATADAHELGGGSIGILSQMNASTSRAVLARPAPLRSLRAARHTAAPSSRSALKVSTRGYLFLPSPFIAQPPLTSGWMDAHLILRAEPMYSAWLVPKQRIYLGGEASRVPPVSIYRVTGTWGGLQVVAKEFTGAYTAENTCVPERVE
jgi:hypothetical protein